MHLEYAVFFYIEQSEQRKIVPVLIMVNYMCNGHTITLKLKDKNIRNHNSLF